jgi:lipooligosaccharide transport system ATP-binding protein
MDEAEQLCDRLVVMDHARIVAEGSPPELLARYSSREVVELRVDPSAAPDTARRLDGAGQRTEVLPDRILVYTDDGDATAARVHELGVHPLSMLARRSTLEDVFLRLTGRHLVD